MLKTDRINRLAKVIEKTEFSRAFQDHDLMNFKKRKNKFNMALGHFFCGSPSCIAGWTMHLFGKSANGLIEIGKLLGLDKTQSYLLFCPDTKTAKIRSGPNDKCFISPQRAANTLRHLAKTGEVDWDATTVQNAE